MSIKGFSSLLSVFKNSAKATQTSAASTIPLLSTGDVALPNHSYSKVWYNIENFLAKYDECEDRVVSSSARTIALLFIVKEDLPNELLWRLWIERLEYANYHIRVCIHAKDESKIRSRWIKDRLVRKFHLNPGWGSLDLTKTMACLMFEAMIDCPSIDMFLFVSESCMPLCSVNTVFQTLFHTHSSAADIPETSQPSQVPVHKSWLKYRDTPNNGYSRIQQFDILKDKIPAEHILKSDQWVAITRSHARKIFQCIWYLTQQNSSKHSSSVSTSENTTNTNNNTFLHSLTFTQIRDCSLFSLFHGMKASDEMFFATVLSMLQCRHEIEPRRWTYAEWEGQAASPLTFKVEDYLKNLPNISDLFNRSSMSSSTPLSAIVLSTVSGNPHDTSGPDLYKLPADRFLNAYLIRSQHEHTFFTRKICWKEVAYYKTLPSSSSTSHDSKYSSLSPEEAKRQRHEDEIQDLFAHGPVHLMLDWVQRWWLFTHRAELQEIIAHGQLHHQELSHSAAVVENESVSNLQKPRLSDEEAITLYWRSFCVPIIENVLYYNRKHDDHHPLASNAFAPTDTTSFIDESTIGRKRAREVGATAESIYDTSTTTGLPSEVIAQTPAALGAAGEEDLELETKKRRVIVTASTEGV